MQPLLDDWVTGCALIACIVGVCLGYYYGPWIARTMWRALA